MPLVKCIKYNYYEEGYILKCFLNFEEHEANIAPLIYFAVFSINDKEWKQALQPIESTLTIGRPITLVLYYPAFSLIPYTFGSILEADKPAHLYLFWMYEETGQIPNSHRANMYRQQRSGLNLRLCEAAALPAFYLSMPLTHLYLLTCGNEIEKKIS